MKCPICNNEMKEGGLIGHRGIIWVPLETFNKGFTLFYKGARALGTLEPMRKTKVPNAYYCEHCNKVMGIFDVNK